MYFAGFFLIGFIGNYLYFILLLIIMKLKYTTIVVEDMEKTIDFYQKNFGFETEEQLNFPDKTITILKNEDEYRIELVKENNDNFGLSGIVFEVDDLSKEVQKFKENNPDIEVSVNEVSNNTLAFINDPNGVNIILMK